MGILNLGVNIQFFKNITKEEKFNLEYNSIDTKGKKLILGIDHANFHCEKSKLNSIYYILKNNPSLVSQLYFVEILVYNPVYWKPLTSDEMNSLNDFVNKINQEFNNILSLFFDSYYSHKLIAYSAKADVFFVFSNRHRYSIFPQNFIVIKDLFKQTNYRILISELLYYQRGIKGLFTFSPFCKELINETFLKTIQSFDTSFETVNLSNSVNCLQDDTNKFCSNFLRILHASNNDDPGSTFKTVGLINIVLLKFARNFVNLNFNYLFKQYNNSTNSRLILFDYQGTLIEAGEKLPENFCKELRTLSQNPKNYVFIVSGKEQETLDGLFQKVPEIGLCAENGIFFKWNQREGLNREWKSITTNLDWYF